MSTSMKRNRLAILLVSVFFVLTNWSAFAKKAEPELVKQEEGYYYGYGKGATAAEAEFAGKRDLVESALTAALRSVNPKAPRVQVSDASVKARITDIKPYSQSKKNEPPAVTYRMKIVDWDKKEKLYTDALRADLSARLATSKSKKNPADKLSGAVAILEKLVDEGETELLSAVPDGTELLSRRAEALCTDVTKNLGFTFSVKDGIVNASTKFSIKVADTSGNAAGGLPVTVTWEAADLPTDAGEVADVRTLIKADALGTISVAFPADENFRNRAVTLTVQTALAKSVPSSAVLKKLDTQTIADAHYVRFDDINAAFPSVVVPEGEFNAGAVPQDTRAQKKEAAHTVSTVSYAIDVTPVTNARYAAFLHTTRAESAPDYFDNPDYNQGKQPVVAVSYSDAEAYAAWLSEQTGFTYRLPTEEEWEKAARAGADIIYPWGDENPTDGKRANYKGNGKFTKTSPVGSFENGNNAWGLVDMSGNVAEWTSSSHGIEGETNLRTVKGGSWMDGPTELRISNYRNINSQNGYADVGFRLVKEVSE
ncbi:sulfatase-modifying factor enzyme 1 [Treponema socranskii subsp. socranskii VPI DR56BR1116 = ATCC 35536]|uniref:Sulfatase-modifying factor enzyme 1 n=1 Tax=Treponema socranskii subsp. socranskii VPI DR56BR1116 = ATCC 35536 TaxID=1125725 RepID=A0ABP2YKK2_TRESO|nr:SUMF1/EgtB/PvdO family nonheme iron enzyme [Treponema socranskii]ERK01318.1 sulfatase-modifying factor enzyme 1 [Treponema socranskii subsp. socranskii VPI DR56BR1116 = ATCC 35536]